jgi:hypothetical protein
LHQYVKPSFVVGAADDGRQVVAILQFVTAASLQHPTTDMKLLITQELPASQ